MITRRTITAADLETAKNWWVGPYALPHLKSGVPNPHDPSEYTTAFESAGQVIAVGGFTGRDYLPAGTAQLSIAISTDIEFNKWVFCSHVGALVDDAFAAKDITMVIGHCVRDSDAQDLFPVWRWLVDRVVRDHRRTIAAGGWWHNKEGDTLDPDTASTLYFDWVTHK